MSYKLGQQNSVQHIESGAWIPARFENGTVVALDDASPLVQAFIAWVAAGGIPDPAPGPTVQQQMDAIDAQMAAMEQAKILGRTSREGELWGLVKEYLFYGMGVKDPLLATPDQQSQAIAALSNPSDPHYNVGFTRLKAFDDLFVALRAQRDQLKAQL